ncbi:MAG: EAL domain-containing protein [Alphaproteobacteria bacterium]|nr:EAL domain-containing protein [Alphaproteobacteria bacterium]
MLSRLYKFTDKFSIKTQVTSLVIFCFSIVTILSTLSFNSINLVETSTQISVDFAKFSAQLHRINEDGLQMRQHEKDYLILQSKKYEQLYFAQINNTLKYIRTLIKQNPMQEQQRLIQIQAGLAKHKIQFQKVVALRETLGLTASQGVEGELRNAVHNIENRLNQISQKHFDTGDIDDVKVQMLLLRGYEKDFMLRGTKTDLEKFSAGVLSFKNTLKYSQLALSDKNIISTDLRHYHQIFDNWSRIKVVYNAETEQLNTVYAHFSPITDQLISKYETLSMNANKDRINNQRISKNILIFGIALLAGLLLAAGIIFLLFHQHQKIKNILEQKTTLTDQKNSLLKQTQLLGGKNIKLANTDALTSLPNRRNFFAQLEILTQINQSNQAPKFIVGLLDLDGFKRINDVFGHPAGDSLLVKTSERLSDILGENILLARLGGDEFGLIITDPNDIANVEQIGQKICDEMSQTFHLREGSVQIGATVGFVEFPSMALTTQSLFERADYALCYSKQNSKGTPVIFSAQHETIIRNISNIEHQLRESDLEQELSVVFQPIIDSQLQKTIGFEALARWHNQTLGHMQPDIFIRSAEQMGIINKLTTILLSKALQAASQWPDDMYMSFNLSIYDLSSPQTILSLVNIVEKSNFPSKRIIFEITESAVMHDFQQANEALKLLKLQGAQIALDDFGTGYSSLSYVQLMPLDRLKIDRSFITNIVTDNDTRNIVKTILDLCNNLNLNCIVEGVETAEQLTLLQRMGCRYFQGYYFSKPLNNSATNAFLAQQTNIRDKLSA